jgi:conserved hypothetical protein|nr:MAG TPA: tail sheath protein [Caudoviricetes sp.]
MRNNLLDDIIKCDIEISNPASNDISFGMILLILEKASATGKKPLSDEVIEIAKADELLDYGYKATDSAYIATSVCFSQKPSPNRVYACVRKKPDTAYEDLKATLDRANSQVGFYGFHITGFKDKADVVKAADWAEANHKLFGFEYDNIANMPLTKTDYYRTFALYSGTADGFEAGNQPKENAFAALALMAKCFSYEPGTETWHLKVLNRIYPSLLSSDQKKSLEGRNIGTILRYAGTNCSVGGAVISGEWIDIIRFVDWLKNEMQNNLFRLFIDNKKIPYNDSGINLILCKIEETLKKAQDIGGISLNEFDEDGNEIPGYSIKVPNSAQLTEETRKSRKLTGCTWSARVAGAIHAVEIQGTITF